MKENFLTISELNRQIKTIVDSSTILQNIVVRGELQSFKKHVATGSYFFKLVENKTSISCMIPSFIDNNYDKQFKDGDLVEVVGSVTYFNNRGEINFKIYSIKLVGDGEKLLRKMQLIEKLYKNGYIDKQKKRPIVKFPNRIGVITSSTGAAIADIRKNIFERTKRVELYVFPCIVQGSEAKNSILKAIEKAKSYNLDTLIIGRGGGSKDDLAAFDEEEVAMAVVNFPCPVISAVGHEIDKSVADYVSDLCVSTPTAAAVAAVPNDEEILDYLNQREIELTTIYKNKVSYLKEKIKYYDSLSYFRDLKNYFKSINEKIENTEKLLENYWKTTRNLLIEKINRKNELLDSLNPMNILDKGYSIIYDENNHVIDSVERLKNQNAIIVQMKDGKVVYKGGN